jgi:hypothetical protein
MRPALTARGFDQAYIDNTVARTCRCNHQSLYSIHPRIKEGLL